MNHTTIMNDYKIESSNCPGCGKQNDGAANLEGAEGPEPGDYSICIGCQGIFVFDSNLHMKEMTEDDILELPSLLISRYQRMLSIIKQDINHE